MEPERWQQIQDLFDRALELDGSDRETFLGRETAGDDDLRMEVESLLAADHAGGDFIGDALSDGLDLYFDPEHGGKALSRAEPNRFGKYEILEKIGEGGFGQVYRGRDEQLDRLVAIKTCTAKDPSLRQRFFREARISAGLQHPKIVTIHDYGEQDDLPYLVQELLDGEDLDRLIDRREPKPMRVLHGYLQQIAEGLAYAHGKGVLHRDIKPQNVRVQPDGDIKILDFGIACLVNEQERLTRENSTLGTVGYIAPEQLRGNDLDERSDIFSFGVLAFELLTLERPFQGRSFAEVAVQILEKEPLPLRKLRPDVPEALADLVHRCLAKQPEDRYPSFREVADGLSVITDFEVSDNATAESQATGKEPESKGLLQSLSRPVQLVAAIVVIVGLAWWVQTDDPHLNPTEPSGAISADISPPTPTPVESLAKSPTESPGKSSTELPAVGSETDSELPATQRRATNPVDPPDSSPSSVTEAASNTASKVEDVPRNLSARQTSDDSRSSIPVAADPSGRIRDSLREDPPAEDPEGMDEMSTAVTAESEVASAGSGTELPAQQADPAVDTERESSDSNPGPPGGAEPSDQLAKQASPTPSDPTGSSDGVALEVVQTQPTDVPEPALISRPEPRYPTLAQHRKQEAQVTLAVLVDEEGAVQRTLVTHSSVKGLGFEEAAQEAAMKATFWPARQAGEPIQAWTELTVEFKIR